MGNPFSPSLFLALEEKVKRFPFGSAEFKEYFRTDFVEKDAAGDLMGFKNGTLYTATIFLVLVFIIAALALSISEYKFYYILLAPGYFVILNLIEYLIHRYPMHHKSKALLPMYKHVTIHHNFFANENSYYEHDRDCMAIFLPYYIFLFVSGVVVLISLLIYWIGGRDNALFYALMAFSYYFLYELFHFFHHLNENSFVKKIPYIKNMARLHMKHHNTNMMAKYNFNVIMPIGDKIFNTLHHDKDIG